MFAVIKTGGRQYRVVPDDVLEIGKIAGDVGTIVQLGEVLLVGGDSPVLGAPTVAGASVAAEVLQHKRGPKVISFKKRRRKNSKPQARLSRRDHGASHHRDPDQRQQADHRPASEEGKAGRAAPADGDDEAPKAAKKKAPAKKPAAKKTTAKAAAKPRAKPDAKKAPAKKAAAKGKSDKK